LAVLSLLGLESSGNAAVKLESLSSHSLMAGPSTELHAQLSTQRYRCSLGAQRPAKARHRLNAPQLRPGQAPHREFALVEQNQGRAKPKLAQSYHRFELIIALRSSQAVQASQLSAQAGYPLQWPIRPPPIVLS